MELGSRAKVETGNIYGVWFVSSMITPREVSNGCLKYKTVCRSCGAIKFVNGNNLRFGKYAHTCKKLWCKDMSKSKYKQGKQIHSISEFDQSEKLWFKWRGKTTHRSFLMSLQYRTLVNAIKSGIIFECDKVG